MGQTLLVDVEFRAVSRFIDGIDQDVKVIAVIQFDEYSEARLVLASPRFDQHSSQFNYLEFGEILRKIGDEGETPSPLIMRMGDPFIVALRDIVGSVERRNGLRIGPQPFGNRFVEEGYVFRIRS